MKKSTFGILALGTLCAIGDYLPEVGLGQWSLVKEAHAVVGRPATPGSWAGVARRTARRMIILTSIYVSSLPPNCTTIVIEGTTLHQCGSTYYQSKGSQYVVVEVK